ncbi:ParA family protein [Anaerophilus nitritogenes]|uniref:ParA family protein n=1 Tax=Anaerophilus nitritogenes TaxID=2498136 RepID=UPI00101B96BF|nr:ParA family protein [Anaerophilus nitritogenes]
MIISVVNQKGGVGKTTTTCNLGSCLIELGKKVLLIDSDPQGNLSQSIGVKEYKSTIYDCLTNDLPIQESIINTGIKGLDIVPANIKLANAELELSSALGRETLLRDCIKSSSLDYDYILIDCNPSLSLLTINALAVCDRMIIPLEPSIFALEGISQLIKIINLIKKKINPKIEIEGVLLTRVDSRTSLSKEFKEQIDEIFGSKVFDTVIHQNIAIGKAQIENMPINLFDKNSKGYKEYLALAQEVIGRE